MRKIGIALLVAATFLVGWLFGEHRGYDQARHQTPLYEMRPELAAKAAALFADMLAGRVTNA